MRSKYRRILSESSSSIIGVLKLLAKDKKYDFALLAVRFGKDRHTITRFIIENGDSEALLVSNLNHMRDEGGEPMGFIRVTIQRPEGNEDSNDAPMQISLPFEHMFSAYRTTALMERSRTQKAYLENLSQECALALHAAGLIRLAMPE